MIQITATIITLNEEDRIGEVLESLACCDEVVVVDAGSVDRTREIAAARGARVVEHTWEGYSRQKNLAAEQATHDWILSIDADERLSIELADEIVRWKHDGKDSEKVVAVSMPRRAFYRGKWIGHSGWYPDHKVRLYHRKSARWEGDFVHERMKVEGAIGRFSGDLLHFPFRSTADQLAKVDRYAGLAAEAIRQSGGQSSFFRLLLLPALSFLRTYVLQAGFLDGSQGLAIAYMGARYVFLKELRILR